MANGGSNCKILAGRSLMCVSFKCRVLHSLAWTPSFFFDFGLFLAAAAAGLHTVVCFLSTRRPPPPAPAVVGFQFPGGKRGRKSRAGDSNVVDAFTSFFLPPLFPLFIFAVSGVYFAKAANLWLISANKFPRCCCKFWTERQFRRRERGRERNSLNLKERVEVESQN